ncbi:MAG: hypothetical protein ITG01_05760 [Comamonas sp.]|nr:hypothetical protein [Comamonas sp.]
MARECKIGTSGNLWPLYEELGLEDTQWSDAALVDFMLQSSILINRPIVVTPLVSKLFRPAEAVLDLLPSPQQASFSKEDGEVVIDANGKCV